MNLKYDLEQLLPDELEKLVLFISIVCFSNQAKIKVNVKSNVVQLDYLTTLIKKYNEIVIKDNINELSHEIFELNIEDKSKRKKHIKNIKNKIAIDEKKIDNMICPRCAGNLVLKNGKYGEFIGCSNHPKCKFTKK